MLTKDAGFWPMTLAKHGGGESDSTLLFSQAEFHKGLEIIVQLHLRNQIKGKQPTKEDVLNEVKKLHESILSKFKKSAKSGN